MKSNSQREIKIELLKLERSKLTSRITILNLELQRVNFQLGTLRMTGEITPQVTQRERPKQKFDFLNQRSSSSNLRDELSKAFRATRLELPQSGKEFNDLLTIENSLCKLSDQEVLIFLKKNKTSLTELLPTLMQKIEKFIPLN